MKNIRRKIIVFKLLSFILLIASVVLVNQSFSKIKKTSMPVEKQKRLGLKIATQWDKLNSGWKDEIMKVEMILEDQNKTKSTRILNAKNLEMKNDGDKSLIVFDSPSDVKGTAVLTFSHGTKSDDQWLLLSAIKRVKRISSTNRSGPFMGSEFAYEDLGSEELEEYKHRFIRKEKCGKISCFVVEQIPTNADSGYSKRLAWYNGKNYRREKVEFYDRKGTLLKTLKFTDYKKYLGKYWRAETKTMTNAQNGKVTVVKYSQRKMSVGLSPRLFTKRSLENIR